MWQHRGSRVRLCELPGLWLGALRVILAQRPEVQPWLTMERTTRDSQFIGIRAGSLLNAPTSTGMPFWSINPYIGCEFGCAYCYARETHRWTLERAANHRDAPEAAREAARLPIAESFERRILVKENAAEVLERTLDPARMGDDAVVIGSATDPYQPAEQRFRITRQVLEVFLAHEGLRIGIITKSALVARDAELLAALSRRHKVTVHFSIASLDRALLRQLEPRSAAPHARLRAMSTLSALGVSTDVFIMPILPGLTDDSDALLALMRAARDAGAEGITGGPLRMGPATRLTLLPWLDRHRPDLAARYRRHYGSRRNVSVAYSRALKARLARLTSEAGFDDIPRREWRKSQGELFSESSRP